MPPDTNASADPRRELLAQWLVRDVGLPGASLAPASADASFRRYFRVQAGGRTLIAMDAPPEREDIGPFVRVAAALAATGVSVPAVLDEDRVRGFLLLSDLGSTHYLAALEAGEDPEPLYADASDALLRIQLQGARAAQALEAYGPPLLRRELALFPEWFLVRHLGLELGAVEQALLERLDATLVGAASEQPQVFVHRDYHSRNLMVLASGNPGILDFQDAVRGAVTYDLVSLYKDCYVAWPRERVLGWVEAYRRRALAGGLALPGSESFLRWFDLMGLQRHLKVLGIFARLWYRDGKPAYLADLPRVLEYVVATSRAYPEVAELAALLETAVLPRFDAAQARARAA
jgi:aminoglycoside/choline kinase family phosphotransferase